MGNLSEKLFKALSATFKDDDFPKELGIVKNCEIGLTGTAFFPGGDGVYKEENPNIKESYEIMVLGQDWGNETGFEDVRDRLGGSEVTGRTFRNLVTFFY